MRAIIISLVLGILLVSVVSAGLTEIIILQQPNEIYNLEDTIEIPVAIKSTLDISGSFQMDLICSGHSTNFYKNGIKLAYGEEKKMDTSLVLTKEEINGILGACKIKGIFKDDEVLTNEFTISDVITIDVANTETEFSPDGSMVIKGGAVKANGEDVNGFIGLAMMMANSSGIDQLETINNGFFSINISLPEDMKAGQYLVRLNAYERDFLGETTNHGTIDLNIFIKQVPANLEVQIEDKEVEPGAYLRVKTILHDQTGENIQSNSIISIKNEEGIVLEQIETPTSEYLEYFIPCNYPPAEWVVVAVSNELRGEASFKILENQEIRVNIINKTVDITNVGNVFYNKSVLVKIGNESLPIHVELDVDESKKYVLSAPDGDYDVAVLTEEGEAANSMVTLTGKSIEIKEASGRTLTLVKYSIVWVFIVAILGFVAFIIFKKGYKKSFFGYIHSRKKEKGNILPLRKKSLINTKNKAEISLSIKGDKQNVSVVCLNVKNLRDIESKKSNAEEVLQKIVDSAEKEKAGIYENQGNLFFIFAPLKTRTFKNENTALQMAQKIKDILEEHNKLAKQKINFGISINFGTIVAKQEQEIMKFMSMGTLITTAKKIASLAHHEILLGEKINDKLKSEIKTEKQKKNKTIVYTIKKVKNTEEHKKFLRSFLNRIEEKKK